VLALQQPINARGYGYLVPAAPVSPPNPSGMRYPYRAGDSDITLNEHLITQVYPHLPRHGIQIGSAELGGRDEAER
jgi:hypothetical protein